MKKEYVKTYGIEKGYNKGKQRFFVVCDGRSTSLHYAKADFAMKKSYEFICACHKDFDRDNGDQVHFIFMQE